MDLCKTVSEVLDPEISLDRSKSGDQVPVIPGIQVCGVETMRPRRIPRCSLFQSV